MYTIYIVFYFFFGFNFWISFFNFLPTVEPIQISVMKRSFTMFWKVLQVSVQPVPLFISLMLIILESILDTKNFNYKNLVKINQTSFNSKNYFFRPFTLLYSNWYNVLGYADDQVILLKSKYSNLVRWSIIPRCTKEGGFDHNSIY